MFLNFTDDKNNDKDDLKSSWEQLFQPEVLRPFRLLMIFFFYGNLLSGVPYQPYLTEVFIKFNAPVEIEWAVVRNL